MNDLILYHGTDRRAARSIIQNGFHRATLSSYTGTGICLSEHISVAYEHGEYEWGAGCVLEVRFKPDAVWQEHYSLPDYDKWFRVNHGVHAVRSYGGNVWVLWDAEAVLSVRQLCHQEALQLLVAEIRADGEGFCYNGVADDYASLVWQEPNTLFDRDPEYRAMLSRNLDGLTVSFDN